MAESDDNVTKVLEELIENPDDLFPTFSEEMAEKARQELRRAFLQRLENVEISE